MPRNANQSKSSNYSLDFDGTSDKITCANSPAITGDFSISLWINQTTTPGTFGYLIEQDGAKLRIGVNTNNTIYFQLSSNSMNSTTAITNGSWAHLVLVKNGSSMNIYIDSVAQTPATAPASHTISSGDLAIGHQVSSSGNGFSGKITEACIFDYALSASQVTTLWGGGTSVSNPMALPSPPIAYYPLGGSAGAFQTPVNSNDKWLIENNAIGDYVFDFDGYPDIINIGNISSLQAATTFTVSAWVKRTRTGHDRIFGSWDAGANKRIIGFAFDSNNTLLLQLSNDGTNTNMSFANSTSTITDTNWHHVLATYNAGTVLFYIDGDQDTTTGSAVSSLANISSTYHIGALGTGDNTSRFFVGDISNIQVFSTVLSPSEATTLYNYGSPIQTLASIPQNSNLKAWYKLDASEIYNSSSTEWSVDNNTYPSTYTSSLKFVASELDRIDMPYDTILNPSSNYTFSIWFNPTSINSNSSLFGSSILNRGVNMYYPPNNTKVTFYHKTSTANENFDIVFPDSPVDTWNNVTVTWSASTGIIRAFINGKYISQKENISDIVWGGTLKVSQYTSYGWYFDGQLSNLAMWDVTLTDGFSGTPTNGDVASGQVAEVYNNGQPQASITGSPVGWWKLNNGGKFITDSSGNNFTATNHSGNFQTGGAIEYAGFVNTLAGESLGMNQSNLVQSDLQTVAPYSKYALNFDGVSEKMAFNSSPIDLGLSSTETWWIKYSNSSATASSIASAPVFAGFHILYEKSTNKVYYRIDSTNLYYEWVIPSTYFTDNLWHHYAIVRDDSLPFSSYIKLYIDGNLFGSPTAVNATSKSTTNTKITDWGGASAYAGIVASFSNIAFWNTALTASEAKEIYNEGLPSNLHNFSGTAPVAWWQMGSNSSYVNGWICADEIGANNGATSNIGQESLVNGVGTTANGVSTGMGVGALVADAPYSTGNAISVNMSSTARGTDIPPTP